MMLRGGLYGVRLNKMIQLQDLPGTVKHGWLEHPWKIPELNEDLHRQITVVNGPFSIAAYFVASRPGAAAT